MEPTQLIKKEINSFVSTSPLNLLPESDNIHFYNKPLVQFADGDDPIFTEYKTIIASTHLTPREALAKSFNKSPEDIAAHISVISWILPITVKTRESNRRQTLTPSRSWSHTRNYGEKFNDTLREHVVNLLTKMGYLATAPMIQPYFQRIIQIEGNVYSSNWSERHIAYAAGLGTFSLSDGFITERGIALRCGSVVVNLELPASPRTAESPYSNCLFYVNKSCNACIARCPAEAVTESGHDKAKCYQYIVTNLLHLKKEYGVEKQGCGLCQVKVPCESRNPTKKLSEKVG